MSNAISLNDSYLLIKTEVGITSAVDVISSQYFDQVSSLR